MGEIETLHLQPGSDMPNSPLPVLVYRSAFLAAADTAERMEQTFHRHGWRGLWRNGIFPYHHYHDDAHEVLGIAAGKVTVKLGGEAGQEVPLKAGDVAILPAGCGHKRLTDKAGLLVIGGYPPGQEGPAILRENDVDEDTAARCAAVPLPKSDPVAGAAGELMRAWRAGRG